MNLYEKHDNEGFLSALRWNDLNGVGRYRGIREI